jgi:hypothetical protein
MRSIAPGEIAARISMLQKNFAAAKEHLDAAKNAAARKHRSTRLAVHEAATTVGGQLLPAYGGTRVGADSDTPRRATTRPN